jgi:hypothetical protein
MMSAEAKLHYADVFGAIIFIAVTLSAISLFRIESSKTSEEIEKTKSICELKTICSQYRDERYSCASAGSFDKCMSIRMKADIYAKAKELCSDDGSINAPPAGIPNFFECELAGFR